MDLDEVCFEKIETKDYNLEDLVKSPESISLIPLIEFRVKLLLKEDIILYPGEDTVVETACLIGKGVSDFCLHILKNEKIALQLLSEGYISDLFIGRVVLKLANFKGERIKLCSGTEVAYIIVNTFSLN